MREPSAFTIFCYGTQGRKERQVDEQRLFTCGFDIANRLVGKDRVRPDVFTIEGHAVVVQIVLAGSLELVGVVIVIEVKPEPPRMIEGS